MTLEGLTGRVRALQDGGMAQMVGEVLQRHEQDIIEYQRIQLLEGRDSDGQDIRPYYSEDVKPHGYFHSRESAGRYAAWKEGLSYPFSVSRNGDAPNLYINGRFYDEMEVRFETDSMMIAPSTGYAANIMAKYGLHRFGLSALKWQVMMEQKGCKDELQQRMKELLYG